MVDSVSPLHLRHLTCARGRSRSEERAPAKASRLAICGGSGLFGELSVLSVFGACVAPLWGGSRSHARFVFAGRVDFGIFCAVKIHWHYKARDRPQLKPPYSGFRIGFGSFGEPRRGGEMHRAARGVSSGQPRTRPRFLCVLRSGYSVISHWKWRRSGLRSLQLTAK